MIISNSSLYLPILGYRNHGEVEGLPLPYYVDNQACPISRT